MKKKLIIAAGLVLLLVLLRILDQHPLFLPFLNDGDVTKWASVEGQRIDGDFLILHPVDGKPATGFDSADWSLAWVNSIEQEIGPLSLTHELPPEKDLEKFRVIILTRAGAKSLSNKEIQILEAFVRRGGVLLFDRPLRSLANLTGVVLGEELKKIEKITTIKADFLSSPFSGILSKLPLRTTLFPLQSREKGVETLLRIDGLPALFARPIGSGVAITLGFDYGATLTALQQGVPAGKGFEVEKKFGFYDYIIEPEDLLLDRTLLDNPLPFADILERAILSTAFQSAPLPRWWYFPYGKEGAFIMTHDEDMAGPKETLPMARYEKENGYTSTFFLIAHPRLEEEWASPANHLEEAIALGGNIELHWNRFPMPFGVWKFEPLKKIFSFERQQEMLNAFLRKEHKVAANRTHYLVVQNHYTQTFRILENAGIEIDVSFGPNRGGKGYLFGTGLPYHPIDTNGKLFSLLELPFVTQEDWGEVDKSFFERLLSDSRTHFHQCIIPILHPNLIVKEEEGEALWKCTYPLAEENRHWITNVRAYLDFYKKRAQSPLSSTWDGKCLRISLEALGEGLAVAVPKNTGTGTLETVRRNGEKVSGTGHTFLGEKEIAFSLPPGKHVLEIYYGSQGDK